MRKSIQFPLIAAVALASMLAIAACGSDDSDGKGGTGGAAGEGTGGSGGSGGTGGIGGEAGTGGTGGEMSPECQAMCDHFTDCKIPNVDSGGVATPCPVFCAGLAQPRMIECFTEMECGPGRDISQQFADCQAYAPCDTACAHVFTECNLEVSPFQSGDKPWDLEICLRSCPFQPWSDAAVECLATADCTNAAVLSCL